MKKGNGTPVFPNIAIGEVVVYRKVKPLNESICATPDEEQIKFDRALSTAKEQLSSLQKEVERTLGYEQAAIIEVQLLMLDDPDFSEAVTDKIASGLSASDAVQKAGEELAQLFAALDDEYMNARSADIRDASLRVSDILQGHTPPIFPNDPFILIAEDLAPSETVQLPRELVLGFITQKGSVSSHTAILARMLGIPSLVQAGIDLDTAAQASLCAIDGSTGQWFLDPDEQTLAVLRKKQAAENEAAVVLQSYRGLAAISKSGKQIHLFANIGSVEDVDAAINGDAEGIGLMRSEFLYMGRDRLPSEEELVESYRQIAAAMQGKPVIIRTLDIGADKQADYLQLPQEENPALGLRGLRLCLENENLFKTQLRAIYRASAHGDVHIMFPMVASVWELQEARHLCTEVLAELTAEGHQISAIPIGVMIETPAAAIMSSELAKLVDFFSVGTNDLTQYTLAVDRQNAHLGRFYEPHHPAVLLLLEHIAKCAKDAGIWAGICGELAADPTLTESFLKMGYAELSMSPGLILQTRKHICESEV